MNKKTGITLAVVFGIFAICCAGGVFFLNRTFSRITEIVEKSKVYAKSAITDIGAEWSLDTYLVYADEHFKSDAEKEKASKMLAEFKKRLGKLISVNPVEPMDKGSRPIFEGERQGFYVRLKTVGTFEKGKAEIILAVRNHQDKQSLSEISMNSELLKGMSVPEAKIGNIPAVPVNK